MKITRYKTFLVDAHRMNFIFFKLYTDTGHEGLGEATVEWNERAVVAALEELGEFLIGKDPFRTDYLISTMHRNWYWRTGVVFRSALSGAEAALLDIKGKALGVPVYELLGGKHRDTVACYGNGWFRGAKTADDFANMARAAVAMGFRGLKWDPFGNAWLEMDRAARNRTIGIVEAVRAAVGPDIDLMIEVHGRLNVPTAIAMARELARFHPRWFEEPVPPESIDALADVRANSPIAIADRRTLLRAGAFHGTDRQARGRHSAAGCGPCWRHAGGAEDRGDGACALPSGGATQPDGTGDERDDTAARGDDPEFLHLGDDFCRCAVAARDRARIADLHQRRDHHPGCTGSGSRT